MQEVWRQDRGSSPVLEQPRRWDLLTEVVSAARRSILESIGLMIASFYSGSVGTDDPKKLNSETKSILKTRQLNSDDELLSQAF